MENNQFPPYIVVIVFRSWTRVLKITENNLFSQCAFNGLKRQVAYKHNIQILCATLSTHVINIYRQSMCLFITGGQEINSQEGTTQGDNLRVFPRPFTHGGGGQVQRDKALMGGTHEGGHRPYGGGG